jgi:hypothetical protein
VGRKKDILSRNNPVSPILSARGYEGRVLWPKYTPGGGVNSGSEPPARPRNTLQSNLSNLVSRENPYRYNPEESDVKESKPRLSDTQLKKLNKEAIQLLESGMAHNEVRKKLDLVFPLYMVVLRYGRKQRENAPHDPSSESLFLKMPIPERKRLRDQAIKMLEAKKSHKQTREKLGVGFKTYLGILRTIPNPHKYGPVF